MANNRIEMKVGRYTLRLMPVLYLLAMAWMCFGLQDIIKTQQTENATLSRRLTASDLKRQAAEQQLAANPSMPSAGIVIISPGGTKVMKSPPAGVTGLQKEFVF